MKKIYLSILIFIILFFAFSKSSYADRPSPDVIDQAIASFPMKIGPWGVHGYGYNSNDRHWIIGWSISPLLDFPENASHDRIYFNNPTGNGLFWNFVDSNNQRLREISGTYHFYSYENGSWVSKSGGPSYYRGGSAYSYTTIYYSNVYITPPTSYDEYIGAGMNLDLSFAFRLTDTNVRLKWDMPEGVDHVELKIIGTDNTTSLLLSGNSYWFNLSEYGDSQGYLNIYLTPYDSNGNWGNTLTINQLSTDFNALSMVSQFYNGYYRRVTNPAGSGYVDIIGTSDIDVNVIEEKPGSSGTVPGSPTIVRNYHSYSPVFEYNTTNENYYQEVINYYVTNNNVVNNNYDTTVNNIDLSTSINVDYDAYFDIDNVTQTCEDIKDEIHQTGNDFSDLFSLFDVVCPFFGGVGAKAFTLFKWVVGIVGGFVGIKILKAFL